MRQLWREGSQHHWVQSVSQLPHLEMHFQPQLEVLTSSFDPCEPSWDQRVRSTVAPLHGVLCQKRVPAPSGGMCRNLGMNRDNVQESEPLALPVQTAALLSGTKPHHSSSYLGVKGVQHTVSLFWLLCTNHTIHTIPTQYSYLLFLCTTLRPHCQHWNVLNYLRPK